MRNNIVLLIAGVLFAGCIGDSSSSSSDADDAYLLETRGVVVARSPDVIGAQKGDLYQVDVDNWRVIITEKTGVYVQRASCSGLDKQEPFEIKIGHTIFFKYIAANVDYGVNPKIVRASFVEAYHPDCLNGGYEVPDNDDDSNSPGPGSIQSCELYAADGTPLGSGQFSAVANGGRAHFRFPKPGGEYGTNITVKYGDRTWVVSNGAVRTEIGGFLWKPVSESDGKLVVLVP